MKYPNKFKSAQHLSRSSVIQITRATENNAPALFLTTKPISQMAWRSSQVLDATRQKLVPGYTKCCARNRVCAPYLEARDVPGRSVRASEAIGPTYCRLYGCHRGPVFRVTAERRVPRGPTASADRVPGPPVDFPGRSHYFALHHEQRAPRASTY